MAASNTSRHGLRVCGTVQGVGFRPFVHRLAADNALSGFVRNDAQGVWIEVEGPATDLARFEERLRTEAPPLARISSVEVKTLAALAAAGFTILGSTSGAHARASVPPDTAPCADCLRELADPVDRRYRYPFINCTACGPRYSLIRDVPYDRAKTTMDAFALCAPCRGEYEDPSDRRFHAEPNACPTCGPSLRYVGPEGDALRGDDALRAACRALLDGRIVAVKGVGGFLLAVDARNAAAVVRLRERKRRPHKPFALMARGLAEIDRLAEVPDVARDAITAPERPIVLLATRAGVSAPPGVAPGLREVGVMLPSTPLHVLLLADGPSLQVMTSGNGADEPIAIEDDDALARLAGIADDFLLHDRAVHTRLDDSVLRIVLGATQPVRRARGLVPAAIRLPVSGPPVLALGADLKNAVCITRDDEAFLSQHIGDLASPIALAFFEETIAKLGRLLDVTPHAAAHDLHPDYHSTRWAHRAGLERVAVQHHHAHIASCLAEHGRVGPAIGVAFDGTGCGPDGDLWGGEILLGGLSGFQRAGHLRRIALPGGEGAIREPWRIGLAALLDAGAPVASLADVPTKKRELVTQMIARRVSTPLATGAGRWFDAIAAIVGLRHEVSYEGQAAIELEAASADGPWDPYPVVLEGEGAEAPFVVDMRPVVRAVAEGVARGVPRGEIGARFHETLAHAVWRSARRARDASRLSLVALSGGSFQNRRLTERVMELLTQDGFEVLVHRRVPPNDGGIALGQAAVAMFSLGLGGGERRKDGSHAPRDTG